MASVLKPILSLKLQEPFFTLIKCGKKSVEGRAFEAAKFALLEKGDTIKFYNPQKVDSNFLTKVVNLTKYKTFEEMLRKEGLDKCLPEVDSIEEGVKLYHSFPGFKDLETLHGVIAIHLKVES